MKMISVLFSMLMLIGNQMYAQGPEQPSIMVIPSDNLMYKLKCIDTISYQGRRIINRDFGKAFLIHSELKFLISAIKETFASRGYPLEDLEQTLKGIQNDASYEIVENYETDNKSMILKTARPDIILDLNYDKDNKGMTSSLALNIEAIDAYTYESIGAATHSGEESAGKTITELFKEQVENNLNNLQEQMNLHFEDLKTNGRKIKLRVRMEEGVDIDFRKDICSARLSYSRWIAKWLKKNTENGYGKRQMNTATELLYTQIRIPMYDDEGYPIAASDWSELLLDDLMDACSISAFNNSNGLGEALLVIMN